MAPHDHITRGQQLALDQLKDIAEASDGALEIVETTFPSVDGGTLCLRVSVDTRGYERAEGGFSFRNREPINIHVPPRYPVVRPDAEFTHKRFLGYPHVQCGYHICMYLSPDFEWAATDGMYGFVQRLHEWLNDAALNNLDPEDAPLHPPVVYPRLDMGFVFDHDTPAFSPDHFFWAGAAHLKVRNRLCFDVTGWTPSSEEFPKDTRLAACLLLSTPLPMEYPDTVYKLITTLEVRGVPFHYIFTLLKLFALHQKEDEALYVVLGTPMRRRTAGEAIRQHLSVWCVGPASVADLRANVLEDTEEDIAAAKARFFEWAASAKTDWCSVYDNREEVTYRRDGNTGANWIHGKNIAILGCGALGSHIGEYVVRAGARKITLVDKTSVKPGILVRQQYDAQHVGFTKQSAMRVNLLAIAPECDVVQLRCDLRRGLPDDLDLGETDLIIDATASRHVAASMQLELESKNDCPPLLACCVDSTASRGLATLRMPQSTAGPSDINRGAKLSAFTRNGLGCYAAAFWPDEQSTPSFQPEPGCSDPTFVGSAADVAFFSSSFFDFCVHSIQEATQNEALALFISKSNKGRMRMGVSSRSVSLPKLSTAMEALHGYRVCITAAARKSIEAEINRNVRIGDRFNETGDLLLGEIDDVLATIYLDTATGAPADSFKSPDHFECGIEGTEEICEYHRKSTGRSTSFLGVWHTHPVSLPNPSTVDLEAMVRILHLQPKTPRHVIMLIVGQAASKPIWQFHLFRRNQFKVLKVPIDE